MRTKTLSEYPGLIGEVLRRHEARERRRNYPFGYWPTFIYSAVLGVAAGIGIGYSLAQLWRFLFRL